jgi:oligoendopeptidase F
MLRLAAAAGLQAAYELEAPLLASALNHLAGFRTSIYKLRGWRSVLKEPLANQRMSEATLEAMWAAIAANQAPATAYLRRRAERIGADVLTTADLSAPDGADERRAPYPEVAGQVVRHFERFHPTMGEFARTAFAEGWVDTANGPGRGPV